MLDNTKPKYKDYTKTWPNSIFICTIENDDYWLIKTGYLGPGEGDWSFTVQHGPEEGNYSSGNMRIWDIPIECPPNVDRLVRQQAIAWHLAKATILALKLDCTKENHA